MAAEDLNTLQSGMR
jgi:hypothetical protein